MAEREFTYANYYQYLTEHKLMGTRCRCDRDVHLPPRPYCMECAPQDNEWVELSGEGKLMAFTVIYVGTTQMIDAGFGRNAPYCVGIVKLREGPSISALLQGVDVQKPETIKIGMALVADFVELGPEGGRKTMLAFKPA